MHMYRSGHKSEIAQAGTSKEAGTSSELQDDIPMQRTKPHKATSYQPWEIKATVESPCQKHAN